MSEILGACLEIDHVKDMSPEEARDFLVWFESTDGTTIIPAQGVLELLSQKEKEVGKTEQKVTSSDQEVAEDPEVNGYLLDLANKL